MLRAVGFGSALEATAVAAGLKGCADRTATGWTATGGRRNNHVAPPPSTAATRRATTPMTKAGGRGFMVKGGVTVGADTAAARTRRVMSDAGSETDPSRTGSADAASKTLAATSPADGRADGSAERHEAST